MGFLPVQTNSGKEQVKVTDHKKRIKPCEPVCENIQQTNMCWSKANDKLSNCFRKLHQIFPFLPAPSHPLTEEFFKVVLCSLNLYRKGTLHITWSPKNKTWKFCNEHLIVQIVYMAKPSHLFTKQSAFSTDINCWVACSNPDWSHTWHELA